jgi:hypothetical protein
VSRGVRTSHCRCARPLGLAFHSHAASSPVARCAYLRQPHATCGSVSAYAGQQCKTFPAKGKPTGAVRSCRAARWCQRCTSARQSTRTPPLRNFLFFECRARPRLHPIMVSV